MTSYCSKSDPHLFGFFAKNGARAYWFLVGRQILLTVDHALLICVKSFVYISHAQRVDTPFCAIFDPQRSVLSKRFFRHAPVSPKASCHSLPTLSLISLQNCVFSQRFLANLKNQKGSKIEFHSRLLIQRFKNLEKQKHFLLLPRSIFPKSVRSIVFQEFRTFSDT